AFVMALVRACGGRLKRVCVGYDWRFGRGREGDVALLSMIGGREGFEVTAIPAVEVGGVVVRSTRVREGVGRGELEMVKQLLGRSYGISGKVVEGQGLGRKIGFRTANLEVENRLMPPYGVYAVGVMVDGTTVGGVANFGVRPTVAGDPGAPVFEIHLFDREQDLYGKVLRVELVSRLRGEQKFGGVDDLREQISKDIESAKVIMGA
ncbi:MAG: riboflavin kinase, partial [Verrucomicrobiales bacterium]|nr:riboflavin kinase [Verrucomicrobiales bacterium]